MSSVPNPQTETLATLPVDLVWAIRPEPQPASSEASHVHFDVCLTWLEVAIRHLSDAQVAQVARIEAWNNADEYSRIAALKWEFEASIQAIVASGVAVDAFCAVVRTRVQLPQSLIDEWRENGTARCIQISETLRRAFSLEPTKVSGLRQNLGEIFRFRDLAIDPSAKMDVQILHPELGVGVEWRLAYFRYQNSLLIVNATLRLFAELAALHTPKDADLQKYIDALRSSVEALQNSNALRAQVSDAHLRHKPPKASIPFNPDTLQAVFFPTRGSAPSPGHDNVG